MILRRTNQKFDMPKEIGHDECLRQVAVKSHRTRGRSGLQYLPLLRHRHRSVTKSPESASGYHGFRVSSPLVPAPYYLELNVVPCKRAISLSRPSNSGLGSISNHTCHGATFFLLHCRLYLYLCVSLLLDTRRGVKTLCRRPLTVISKKTATSSNPGTVRDYAAAKAPRECFLTQPPDGPSCALTSYARHLHIPLYHFTSTRLFRRTYRRHLPRVRTSRTVHRSKANRRHHPIHSPIPRPWTG
jgi:hypothetical protein